MPRPGSLEEYEILHKIGSGSYGTCRKVRRKKDGKVLVWKEMDYGEMSESEKSMLVSEVNLLRELKHPFIVRYYDRIIDRTNTKLYIIMEFCESGDLGTLIQQHRKESTYVPEEFVWKIFAQITSALKECHRKESGQVVLHRDLKPANCFLDRARNVKLGDFGLARVLQHETSFAKTFVGSPYYISPELWNNHKYNEKTDIWSLGCLIYELCALRPPFLASNQKELAAKIRSGRFARIPLHFSDDLNQVIGTMLRVSEDARPSIENLMEHPRITEKLKILQSPVSKSPSSERKSELKKLEAQLNEREKGIYIREKALDVKSKKIELLEKELTKREEEVRKSEKELLKRKEELEKHISEDKNLGKPRRILQDHSNGQSSPPCLLRLNRELTPRKSVHFDDKRNDNRFARRERLFQNLNKVDDMNMRHCLQRARARQTDCDVRCKNKQMIGLR